MPPPSRQKISRSVQRARVVKALAHPSRILIAEALLGGERCVCELHEIAGADLSTVSRHLAVMRNAGVLLSEKRGLNIYYRLACGCFKDFFCCVDGMISGSPSADSTPPRRRPRTAR